MIRVALPYHLRNLAGAQGVVDLLVDGAVTQNSILDALEVKYPVLRGTIRDTHTHKRREFIRFFTCGQDISLWDPDEPLPGCVAQGDDVFRVIGAMAGG